LLVYELLSILVLNIVVVVVVSGCELVTLLWGLWLSIFRPCPVDWRKEVVMEVAWRGPEQLSRNPAFDVKSKKKKQASSSSWGVDAHKVLQLMMGQQQQPDYSTSPPVSSTDAEEATLDLLGLEAANSSPRASSDHNNNFITEFPELDPDQPRLPPDWKTCLDLKVWLLTLFSVHFFLSDSHAVFFHRRLTDFSAVGCSRPASFPSLIRLWVSPRRMIRGSNR
jgi:hypothetical protein